VEFAVEDIREIDWNPEPWERLAIEEGKKEMIHALARSHVNGDMDDFDDIVRGKGRGLVMLFQWVISRVVVKFRANVQSGPPGVGKTLTAEGLSELLQRPLLSVSAAWLCCPWLILMCEVLKRGYLKRSWRSRKAALAHLPPGLQMEGDIPSG
jgi:hypothetical protein